MGKCTLPRPTSGPERIDIVFNKYQTRRHIDAPQPPRTTSRAMPAGLAILTCLGAASLPRSVRSWFTFWFYFDALWEASVPISIKA